MADDSRAGAPLAGLHRSPLMHLEEQLRAATVTGDRSVALREWAFLTMVDLRVDPASAAADRVADALGTTLPARCGEVEPAGAHTVLWLGPDEWLVVSQSAPAELVALLEEALGDDHGSVVDVSANRTTLGLSGRAARQVLEKGCPVDLHPRAFPPGRAVSTTLGPIPVVVWKVDDASYRLFVRSSFADYLARWLVDAMLEYTGPEVP